MTVNLAAQAFGDDLPASVQRSGLTGIGVSDLKDTIVVYTAASLRLSEKKRLPEALTEGIALEYRRAAPFSLKDDMPEVVFGQAPGAFRGQRYTCGSSISVANRRSAGTVGCLVKDAQGQLFGLTNNHVTGGWQ